MGWPEEGGITGSVWLGRSEVSRRSSALAAAAAAANAGRSTERRPQASASHLNGSPLAALGAAAAADGPNSANSSETKSTSVRRQRERVGGKQGAHVRKHET